MTFADKFNPSNPFFGMYLVCAFGVGAVAVAIIAAIVAEIRINLANKAAAKESKMKNVVYDQARQDMKDYQSEHPESLFDSEEDYQEFLADYNKGPKASQKENVMRIVPILILGILATTPASAFAQVIQESDMVSPVTTSIISNAFIALVTVAYAVGGFLAIYSFIKRSRKAMMFAARTVVCTLGAALVIALAGMLLPYTSTGMVAQDMAAIAMFSAIVLLTGMGAVTFRADAVLTAKEKAAVAAEKARAAKANAERNAKIEAELEACRLEGKLETMVNFDKGISQRIINEKKAGNLGNGCFKAFNQKHGLGVEIDWSYGPSRSRYMGHWPADEA